MLDGSADANSRGTLSLIQSVFTSDSKLLARRHSRLTAIFRSLILDFFLFDSSSMEALNQAKNHETHDHIVARGLNRTNAPLIEHSSKPV